jgi:hypothetical protein
LWYLCAWAGYGQNEETRALPILTRLLECGADALSAGRALGEGAQPFVTPWQLTVAMDTKAVRGLLEVGSPDGRTMSRDLVDCLGCLVESDISGLRPWHRRSSMDLIGDAARTPRPVARLVPSLQSHNGIPQAHLGVRGDSIPFSPPPAPTAASPDAPTPSPAPAPSPSPEAAPTQPPSPAPASEGQAPIDSGTDHHTPTGPLVGDHLRELVSMSAGDVAAAPPAEESKEEAGAGKATEGRRREDVVSQAAEAHSTASASEVLLQRARARHLRVEPVAGDGNCQFHALALSSGFNGGAPELRRRVAQWLSGHAGFRPDPSDPDTTLKDFCETDVEAAEDWGDYCERMAQEGQWGGHRTLVAAAHVLRRPILVVTTCREAAGETVVLHPRGEGADAEVVAIGLEGEVHYQALLPVVGPSQGEAPASDGELLLCPWISRTPEGHAQRPGCYNSSLISLLASSEPPKMLRSNGRTDSSVARRDCGCASG